jgi:hypothetical protein
MVKQFCPWHGARSTRLLAAAVLGSLLFGCQPDFPNRASIVDGPRVLAVQSSPAQAKPSAPVSFTALVVGPNGTVTAPDLGWSFCSLSKPPSQINDVNSDCFNGDDPDAGVISFGSGETAMGKVPANACKQFGPDVPKTPEGPGRPVDPDATGGYYQPVVLDLSGTRAVAEMRLVCGLAGSPSVDQLNLYLALSKNNENPQLTQVSALELSAPLSAEGSATPLAVPAGTKLTLRAEWPACPATPVCGDGICSPLEGVSDDPTTGTTACPADCQTNPHGCAGAEPYASLDPLTRIVNVRHEEMRVSWFATAGAFDSDHTGNTEAQYQLTSSSNAWKSPSTPGPVFMWVVLHDSRGGVSWLSFQLSVN